MIQRAPMGSILRPSNPGNGSTEDTTFIQFVDGRDPQIHELWCLGLENISRKVHPTAQVEVVDITFGEFVTNYLAENGLRIHIIGQLSVNDSVYFLGVRNQAWGRGFMFISTYRLPEQ